MNKIKKNEPTSVGSSRKAGQKAEDEFKETIRDAGNFLKLMFEKEQLMIVKHNGTNNNNRNNKFN